MDFCGPILDAVTRVWDCTTKHARYIMDLQENMESLRNTMEELKNVHGDVKRRVEREEQRQMKWTAGSVKPGKNSIIRKKGKTVISVKNLEFFLISDDETDFIVGIVLRNLVTLSNFVEFRNNRNFTFFETPSVASDT